ncbi:hypothetical protein [Paenibacillus sp. NPDC058174]|uniref:hypothetical protein n=1 Tax=Paenibacillus sp. NPDC058174 TaxID=3346366 RepID=UPI0036DA401B
MAISDLQLHWDTVLRVSPILYMDRLEPFQPIRVGVTVFDTPGPSPSFDRSIEFDTSRIGTVIEYAIYYDYDIQHIYDLEHVWVYLDHKGQVVSAEASFHGRYFLSLLPDRSNMTEQGQVKLYVQPGKHAMIPIADFFRLLPNVESCCQADAGVDGTLEPEMFSGQFKFGDDIDERSEKHLREFSFQPSFDYIPHTWASDAFVSWTELTKEIPVRMKALLAEL